MTAALTTVDPAIREGHDAPGDVHKRLQTSLCDRNRE
jgi:hypothetical protein